MAEERLIIGLTGPISGGKGVVADILKEKGFFYTSTSDRVREEVRLRKEEITREKLQKVADELRQTFGPEVLAKRSWEIIEKEKSNAIIDSIRGEMEVDFLQTKPGFFLIGVTAPRELRFERARERVREGETWVWEKFVEIDKKDFDSGRGKGGRNIQACLDKADFLIENTGTLEELRQKVEEILEKISGSI